MVLGAGNALASGSMPGTSCAVYSGSPYIGNTGQIFSVGSASTELNLVCPMPASTPFPGQATNIYFDGYGNTNGNVIAKACLTYAHTGGAACGATTSQNPGLAAFQYSLDTSGWHDYTSGSDAYVVVVSIPGIDQQSHWASVSTISYN